MVRLLLNARNILLLHVENLGHSAEFKAKLSDKDGKPLDGLVFSTSPKKPRR